MFVRRALSGDQFLLSIDCSICTHLYRSILGWILLFHQPNINMPRTSRKANFNFNNYTATSKRPSGSAAATSGGASLSVTKFGQTTYTSIRRQKDGENGSFVPLKTALDNKVQKEEKSDEEVVQQTTTTTSKVDNSPKPKVYKFFKSRSAPSDQSPNGKQASSSSSSSSTKQVSPTPKADTSKRYDLINLIVRF